MTPISLVIEGGLSRALAATAAVRELGRHVFAARDIRVHTAHQDLFDGNPWVSYVGGLKEEYEGEVVRLGPKRRSGCHELLSVLDEVDTELGTDLRLREFKPDLYIPLKQQLRSPTAGGALSDKPYWVFSTAGNYDYTVSWVSKEWWQNLVNRLSDYPDFPLLVHVSRQADAYKHLGLQGAVDITGKTSISKLKWVVYHSRGVITTGTALSHLAAAFDKPAVVIAGAHRSRWEDGYSRDVLERYGRTEHGDYRAFFGTKPQVYLDEGSESCGKHSPCGCSHLGERGTAGACAGIMRVGLAGAKLPKAACMEQVPLDWVIDAARSEDAGDDHGGGVGIWVDAEGQSNTSTLRL